MSQFQIALPTSIVPGANVRATTDAGINDRDARLLDRFMAGEDAAFVHLFNTHNHKLYSYCVNIVRDADAAEDITQEMWEKVLRMRVEPRVVKNPAGLFVTIVRNLSLNYLRNRRKFAVLDGTEESLAASHHERTEQEEMVVLALEKLSFDYREVLILNAYSGYSLEEIAVMLGKSREAIWKRASRARAQLSKIVVKMLETEERTAFGVVGGTSSDQGESND
ncbi:MAG TPA: RNA polymerase sigma factor [Candidatus Kapabacteria bacterium]|nr:RNA polymerase sigma factor [Candidatus Kapabacteria bacterium]